MSTLWSGRFGDGPAESLWAFTVSLPFDQRLAADDVAASIAHVHGLQRGGLLTQSEAEVVIAALRHVGEELVAGTFVFEATDEDIHTAIERRVTDLAGPAGGKLHTGRSRNDQVATALRLWTRRAIDEVAAAALDLADVLAARADEAEDAYLPGYTHLQRAQPVLVAHHLLAHGWALVRDVGRLLDGRARVDISPLGAGAIAGSSLPLDPDGAAAEMGFAGRFENSIDATGDRDFVAETLNNLALLGVHLSRIGEEVALWSSDEFGFMRLADAYATGSSMLPQKKNPDVAELARGKAGRLIGHAAGFMATLKGLPLAYNRDLQEDKEPLFDAVDQVLLALRALGGLMASSTFDYDRMQAAADAPSAAAVDLAEWLVEQGTPFREAHGIVGELVRSSLERHVPLGELVEAHPALGSEALELLEPGAPISRRRTPGGTGPAQVADQRRRFAATLAEAQARLQKSRKTSP
ncbi:MAG TPA: argininosuccinate lyase [Acidimicrobiales bacterium]|nr:argininosuccinate lyase [Acidimicrobiales bacterium]